MTLDSTVMLRAREHTLSLTASLQEDHRDHRSHFTNKKTEAQGKTTSSRVLSIWSPGGPRIHYVVQAGSEPLILLPLPVEC